jgi:hypothetical protein
MTLLQTAQPTEEEPENYNNGTVKMNKIDAAGKDNSSISRTEFVKCLNENVGENRETLLHVAAQRGHVAIIRYLYKGCLNLFLNITTRGIDKVPEDHVTWRAFMGHGSPEMYLLHGAESFLRS